MIKVSMLEMRFLVPIQSLKIRFSLGERLMCRVFSRWKSVDLGTIFIFEKRHFGIQRFTYVCEAKRGT